MKDDVNMPVLRAGRGHRWTIAAAGLALVASACGMGGGDTAGTGGGVESAPEGGEAATASDDRAGDVMTVVLPEEPPTLDPCDATLSPVGRVARTNITEALTFRDADGTTLRPMLATEWERIDDLTWEFTLREGVTFHDGSTFDSSSVLAAFERALDPAVECHVRGYIFGDSTLTVTAPDESTVRIATAEPDPILPLRVSFVGIPGPETPADEKSREPIGTGPYVLDEWTIGESIHLERFGDYWGEAPDIGQVEYQWRSEATIRTLMVPNGEADIAVALPPEAASEDLAVTFPNSETTYMRLDLERAPLDDLRVRQAIAHAINVPAIVEEIFNGLGEVATQIIPPGVVGYNPDIPAYEFNPERSRELLDEARTDGVEVDQPITIFGRIGMYPKATETATAIQAMLADVGLTVELEMMEVSAWLEYLLRPFPPDVPPNLLQAQHGNQAGDAVFTMYQNYGQEGSQSAGGTDDLDALIAEAAAAEGEQRVALYQEALMMVHESFRDVPIAHMEGVMMISDRVDFTPDSQTTSRIVLKSASWAE